MFVLIAYDVEARRTSKMRKALAPFLGHEQNSVFFGNLSESGARKLRAAIAKVAKPDDKILEISAANRHNVKVALLKKHPESGVLQKIDDRRHRANAAAI